jgi:hypothetical protein
MFYTLHWVFNHSLFSFFVVTSRLVRRPYYANIQQPFLIENQPYSRPGGVRTECEFRLDMGELQYSLSCAGVFMQKLSGI